MLLAIAAILAGYIGLCQTLGYVMRRGNAVQAHLIAPGDGRITAIVAGQLSGPTASVVDRARADRLARLALRQDPTTVGAATVLGLNADLRGSRAVTRHFLNYAQALSRREIAPQLWAIEAAVARNDIRTALHHYDVALRTSKRAPDLLYPVLAAANSDPAVRKELALTLATRPAWGSGFIGYLSMNNDNPVAGADLFRLLANVGFPVPPDARAAVVKALLANDRGNEAWAYYASFRSGVDRRRSRDERFTQTDAPTVFDWNLLEGGVNGSFQRGQKGGVFEFVAPAGTGGIVLEQVQYLPEGTYGLKGHSLGIDQPKEALPYWTLLCNSGIELGRINVPASIQAGSVFSGAFTVPAGCPVQTLKLIVRASETITGATGQITSVRLYPVIKR